MMNVSDTTARHSNIWKPSGAATLVGSEKSV
jgi:hypothetical protein